MSYNKKIGWLIVVSTLARILLASSTELGNTEAYYWVLANKLEWNYFDHPPIVAWLIRLTTANLLLHGELFVRLGAITSAAFCTWLIYRLGTLLHGQLAGWFAAFLYTTCLYASIGIGVYILPDSAQMVFWISSLIAIIKLLECEPNQTRYKLLWLVFGVLTGLCIMSKVHGVFIWIGVISYILIYDRCHLKSPYLYISLLVSLLITSPIFIWNIQNYFASYQFQSQRVNLSQGSFSIIRFGKSLGELFFSFGPFQIILIVIGLLQAFKAKLNINSKAVKILLLCNLPLILILIAISLFHETLPHWPGPPLSALIVIPAVWLTKLRAVTQNKLPGVLTTALTYAIIIIAAGTLGVNFYPGTMSKQQTGMKIGAEDATLDMYGWKNAGHVFDSIYKKDLSENIIQRDAPLIVTHWIPAAHIDYYITSNTRLRTYGLGGIDSLHQYYYTNKLKKHLLKGEDAYYLIPSNLFDYGTFDKVTNSFDSFTVDLIFSQYRSGIECKKFYIFRLKGFKGNSF